MLKLQDEISQYFSRNRIYQMTEYINLFMD